MEEKESSESPGCQSFQNNVALIDYSGDISWDASTLYESDKIFDGTIRYDSKFMEIDFWRRITCSVNKKYSQSRKLEEVSEHDFDLFAA